ncbi:glycosyl hydrolase family 18 protein [Bacillus solimangrovi]|uniref:Peptidoglycan hydrolase n=1 Tax=Bacillus solimangrovi TaxID=1305675 RepID=A0A1E5LJU1_9BACI|nr:glycosyl hydrolase family 18 protein [Bacillus solimangrovi]OEH94369.1 peptidoglycan hydrolase [Bacillus solimangrovi]
MSQIEINTRKHAPKRGLVFGVVLSIILSASAIILLFYPFPSNEQVSGFKKEHPIIYKGGIYERQAKLMNGDIYVPIQFLQEQIDDSIYFEESNNSVIVTTKDKVIQYKNEELQYFLNEEPFPLEAPVIISDNGSVYVNTKPLEPLYGFQMNYKEETGAVIVQINGEKVLPAIVKDDLNKHDKRVRTEQTKTSSYIVELEAGEIVQVEEDDDDFYYVTTSQGVRGFIPKKALEIQESYTHVFELEEKTIPLSELDTPVNLTWEAVYSTNPKTENLPDMAGVNVVSPTWFSLSNNEGNVRNNASYSYVEWAKQNGYHVWALFSNDFDPQRTHEVLQSYDTRQKVIRQLLEYSQTYNLDGINVDFENVNVQDGPLVTQFMRELSARMHQAGLTVSMDITFISGSGNWSMFYEREKLATIVDYLIVMAYDEHWGSSPISGSVSSLPWVENNLQKLLEVVPNDRLILAMPLYTRLWKEQETENGNIEVSSKAYSMDSIQQWISEHNLDLIYDEDSGQNYAEIYIEEEKATYKVWIEDAISLEKRVKLFDKYDLAGVATWSRYFASDNIWNDIDRFIQQSDSSN